MGGVCDGDIGARVAIDGVDAISSRDALRRLRAEFPDISESRIRAALVAEWEASTGGVPLVVPVDVVTGTREQLRGSSIVDLAEFRPFVLSDTDAGIDRASAGTY